MVLPLERRIVLEFCTAVNPREGAGVGIGTRWLNAARRGNLVPMSYKWGTHKVPESLYNQLGTQLVMSNFSVIYISDYAAPYPGSFINSFLRLRERVMSGGGRPMGFSGGSGIS